MENQNLRNQTVSEKQISAIFIIFWLIIFAPIGFYLLWKEKKFNIWFANLLILFGILNIIIVSAMLYLIFPELVKLYQDFEITYNTRPSGLLAVIIIIISLIEVLVGIIIRRKIKLDNSLNKFNLLTCFLFFVFQYIPILWLIQSFLLPIYNLTSHF